MCLLCIQAMQISDNVPAAPTKGNNKISAKHCQDVPGVSHARGNNNGAPLFHQASLFWIPSLLRTKFFTFNAISYACLVSSIVGSYQSSG